MNIAIVFASRVSCRCYSLFLSFYEHNHLSYFSAINKITLLNPDIFHIDSHQKLFIISMDSISTALNSFLKLYTDSVLPTLENPLALRHCQDKHRLPQFGERWHSNYQFL